MELKKNVALFLCFASVSQSCFTSDFARRFDNFLRTFNIALMPQLPRLKAPSLSLPYFRFPFMRLPQFSSPEGTLMQSCGLLSCAITGVGVACFLPTIAGGAGLGISAYLFADLVGLKKLFDKRFNTIDANMSKNHAEAKDQFEKVHKNAAQYAKNVQQQLSEVQDGLGDVGDEVKNLTNTVDTGFKRIEEQMTAVDVKIGEVSVRVVGLVESTTLLHTKTDALNKQSETISVAVDGVKEHNKMFEHRTTILFQKQEENIKEVKNEVQEVGRNVVVNQQKVAVEVDKLLRQQEEGNEKARAAELALARLLQQQEGQRVTLNRHGNQLSNIGSKLDYLVDQKKAKKQVEPAAQEVTPQPVVQQKIGVLGGLYPVLKSLVTKKQETFPDGQVDSGATAPDDVD